MRRSLWIVCGGLFFLLCLLMASPAWLVTDFALKKLPQLQLGSVSGSVWRGRVDTAKYGDITVTDLHWHLSLLGIFRGVPLAIDVAGPVKGHAELGVGGNNTLRLRNVLAQGGIAELMAVANLPSMGFDGGLSVELAEASITNTGCVDISGTFTLASLLGDIDGISDIAPVAAALNCENGLLVAVVDENNPTRVRGKVQLMNNGRLKGQLMLTPAPASLLYKSLSQFLGAPRNKTDFVLRF
ncbi:MAG: type II secretion system protein N [Zhongshania sp.]|uniref:type II secretion system protein N n=1 Tax=Zhongshania sp. TaxID=1971902 RepID=UPI00261EE227|nr:type II secretion system protein N [Zhongshania sp.]MDF1690956.1 type II secretion system protein N [Zhongshania sp.]